MPKMKRPSTKTGLQRGWLGPQAGFIHKNQPPAWSQGKMAADNRAAAACRSLAARQGKTTANKHRQPPAGALRSRQEKKDLFWGFNPLND